MAPLEYSNVALVKLEATSFFIHIMDNGFQLGF